MGKPRRRTVVLVLALMMGGICSPQAVDRTTESRKIQLPGTYSIFSEADILGKIFDGYDSTTKAVSNIPSSEGTPTKVSIVEVKLWRVGTEEYLVVLTNLGDPEMLCGNCAMYTPLAVLKTDGSRLSLASRQDLPSHTSFDQSEDVSEIFGSLSLSGHESVALDVAPYKLTDQENLIGVRIEHMWLPASFYQTRLFLFRMQESRLRKVFETPVVDREYPNAHKDGPQIVLKTESTLSTTQSGGSFYRLLVKKTTFECAENEDGDCDTRNAPVRRVKTQIEEWRFDGEKFGLATHPGARPVRRKSNPA